MIKTCKIYVDKIIRIYNFSLFFTFSLFYTMSDKINIHHNKSLEEIDNLQNSEEDSSPLAKTLSANVYKIHWKDEIIFNEIKEMISTITDEKEKARLMRLLRIYTMPNLSEIEWHPIKQIIDRITKASIYEWFDRVFAPEVVSIEQTFDNFNFPKDHVARKKSDTYYIQWDEWAKDSLILRPHISVMRDSYLKQPQVLEKLRTEWAVSALSRGKVYRVDDVDATHHQVFHQIDGLRIVEKAKHIITKDDLKNVLIENVKALFWNEITYQIRDDHFPYTENSMEIDVLYNGQWLEILGSGTVHPNVLQSLWLDPEKYNWRAFGIWVERIAMPVKNIPDIRIFWSEDSRITTQRGTLEKQYEEVSKFPASSRDFSIIIPNSYDEREITELMRDNWQELIEKIEKTSEWDGQGKFWPDHKSVSYRITFRSIDRTLTNDEVNLMYFTMREKINSELWLTLR